MSLWVTVRIEPKRTECQLIPVSWRPWVSDWYQGMLTSCQRSCSSRMPKAMAATSRIPIAVSILTCLRLLSAAIASPVARQKRKTMRSAAMESNPEPRLPLTPYARNAARPTPPKPACEIPWPMNASRFRMTSTLTTEQAAASMMPAMSGGRKRSGWWKSSVILLWYGW